MIDTQGLLIVKQCADYRNISRQRVYKMTRQRVERIEGALLRALNLVEALILDWDKAHLNLRKPDFRRVSEKATKSILLGNRQNYCQ